MAYRLPRLSRRMPCSWSVPIAFSPAAPDHLGKEIPVALERRQIYSCRRSDSRLRACKAGAKGREDRERIGSPYKATGVPAKTSDKRFEGDWVGPSTFLPQSPAEIVSPRTRNYSGRL